MNSALTLVKAQYNPNQRMYGSGNFPKKRDTVVAEVLSELLQSKPLTGMDSVVMQHTTRLAAVIHSLRKDHHWLIESSDIAVATNDGRVTNVTRYRLAIPTIGEAFARGAENFIDEVKVARLNLKNFTEWAKGRAFAVNAFHAGIKKRRDAEKCPLNLLEKNE